MITMCIVAFAWPEMGTIAALGIVATIVNHILESRKIKNAAVAAKVERESLIQEAIDREQRIINRQEVAARVLADRTEEAARKVADVLVATSSETHTVLKDVQRKQNSVLGTQYRLVAEGARREADADPTEANIAKADAAQQVCDNHEREQRA